MNCIVACATINQSVIASACDNVITAICIDNYISAARSDCIAGVIICAVDYYIACAFVVITVLNIAFAQIDNLRNFDIFAVNLDGASGVEVDTNESQIAIDNHVAIGDCG